MVDFEQFYPTPEGVVNRMISLVDWIEVKMALEPSAGTGDIADKIKSAGLCYVDVVEINQNRRAVLKDKGYSVVGFDFLTDNIFSSYDLIMMNPPFRDGEKHLAKAMEMMTNGGQIVCLLNWSTLQNTTNPLIQNINHKLKAHNAYIERLSNPFSMADRKTDVDVALVYVRFPAINNDSYDILENIEQRMEEPVEYIVGMDDGLVTSSHFYKGVWGYFCVDDVKIKPYDTNFQKRIIYWAKMPSILSGG